MITIPRSLARRLWAVFSRGLGRGSRQRPVVYVGWSEGEAVGALGRAVAL